MDPATLIGILIAFGAVGTMVTGEKAALPHVIPEAGIFGD